MTRVCGRKAATANQNGSVNGTGRPFSVTRAVTTPSAAAIAAAPSAEAAVPAARTTKRRPPSATRTTFFRANRASEMATLSWPASR